MPNLDELLIPSVSEDDVDQEMALLRLLGKCPSRAIVRRRLERAAHTPTYASDLPPDTGEMDWTKVVLPPDEVIEELVTWAINQSEEAQAAVFGFLNDPGASTLEELLDELAEQGLLPRPAEEDTGPKHGFAALVLRTIEAGPVLAEDIYELADRNLGSARPRAAARQVLRRLVREGRIIKERDENAQWTYRQAA